MTVTAGKTTADSAAGGALTLKAGIGEGNSGSEGGAVSIQGGLGANTGGAVSVTSGVGTADDSGSMTIATADSGSSGERQHDRDGNRKHDVSAAGGALMLGIGEGNSGGRVHRGELRTTPPTSRPPTRGVSGNRLLGQAAFTVGPRASHVSLSVGDGNTGPGGAVTAPRGGALTLRPVTCVHRARLTGADSAAGDRADSLKAGIGEGNSGSEGGAAGGTRCPSGWPVSIG